MKKLGFLRWAQLILICGVSIGSYTSTTAHAQQEGYQLNRVTPAPAGDAFTLVEYPWYSARLLAAQISFDYARNSVEAENADAPIGHSQYGRLGLSMGFWDRVGLSLNVPVLLYESGADFNGVGPSGTVVSDPRIGVRALLWGSPDSRLSLSASAQVWIPVGAADDHAGDASPRILPRLIAGGVAAEGRVRWGVNAGYLYRKPARLSMRVSPIGNTVGSEVQFAAGASYLAPGGQFSVGPEATLSLALGGDIPDEQSIELLEVFATGRYAITDSLKVGIGVGTAVRGSGPPDARALLSLTFSPSRSTPRLSSFESVVVLPDEDGHVGSVEVDDGKSKIVLETAYASTELHAKSKQVESVQKTRAQLPEASQALAKVLPPRDSDLDGIADNADTCPERPGVASTDALRNGCPPASEKVVVLPDADGHVGAVEVDDGTHIVLIDTPYASAETNTEGKVQAVTSAPAKQVTAALTAIAAILPPADRDNDGILDSDDACPGRTGVASPDSLRNGCAPASEKVVVLPDADGHVGAIEIDNGTTKILLDTAFASADVSTDGAIVLVPPPDSPSVILRATAGVNAIMPAIDTDGDGVNDAEDACINRKGPRSSRAERSGCPEATEIVIVLPNEDGTVGSLEVDDGTSKTLLDKAYATAEVGQDGLAQLVQSASKPALESSLKPLSRLLPKPDQDQDGIIDAHDACKDRPGTSSTEPQRHGCPAPSEQVVLLVDEDGHLGSLSIGEGDNQIILDTPYASADIFADGLVHKIDAAQPDVDTKYAELHAIAKSAKKALPKAAGRVNFVVYFDEQAVPTRDVDAQITALLEELEGKKFYRIEVVGHTDATGSRRTNLRVGNARAAEIARRLGAQGIPTSWVSSSTRGSNEPAVEVVDPKIPEPLNRRVEIRLKEKGEPHIIVHYAKKTKTTRDMKGDYRSFRKQLKQETNYTIRIVGHTDPSESESLALSRANAVARRLRSVGFSKGQMQIESSGSSAPAGEALDPATLKRLNQRVEIFVD